MTGGWTWAVIEGRLVYKPLTTETADPAENGECDHTTVITKQIVNNILSDYSL